ncbi:MAG: type IV pilus modification protein PilV [Xanthomonadaceae bacterium]|nr:type IV pilus modification protein PilV [Xanthomonadaceae bacterium]
MNHPRSRIYSFSRRNAEGFTLVEVMVAVLIMGIGLLSFALLQTMTVRFTQSANQRTQATNLAAELLDQMRTNRILAVQYVSATFDGGTVTHTCPQQLNAVSIAQNVERWQCEVQMALGDTSAADVKYEAGVATVTITWGDNKRWETDAALETGTVSLSTRL